MHQKQQLHIVAAYLIVAVSAAVGQDCGGAFMPDEGFAADDTEGRMPSSTCFQPNGPGAGVCTDDGCIIDILVVYTPAALTALGSQQALQNYVQSLIAFTNTTYQNSEIGTYARLVGLS